MSMIRTLLGYVGEYKKDSILTPLFMIIEVTMEVLIPYVTASIIDDGIQAGNLSHVFAYGGLMLLLALFSLMGGILSARYGASASTGFAKNIRQAMYEKVQTFSFSNIDKFSTAGLITRMTTDVTNLQNAYMMLLRIAVRAPLMLIFSFVMCFVIHARLALIFLGFMALLALFLFFVMRKTIPMFRKVFERYDDLNASVQENVSAIRVVKAFVREEYENDKFTKAATNLADLFIRVEKIMVAFSPVMSLAIYGCMLSLGWFGAHFIVQGTLTTGNLTSLFTYVMQMLGSLMMLSMIFVMITMSTASANRIAEVLQETPDLADPENPVTEVADGSIDFDHVSFAYHSGTGEDTLHDIDLHIKSGETIGVIGGTGSGKSTLVSLISRLYDVTDGAVRVGGVDVRQYDMEALRNQVSVVLQKNVLFSGTILENLRWGKPDATLEECREACRLACADEFVLQRPDGYEPPPSTRRRTRPSARPSASTSPARRSSSSPSASPPCRTPTASSCWSRAGSRASTRTKTCWRRTPSIRKSTTRSATRAATSTAPANERGRDHGKRTQSPQRAQSPRRHAEEHRRHAQARRRLRDGAL